MLLINVVDCVEECIISNFTQAVTKLGCCPVTGSHRNSFVRPCELGCLLQVFGHICSLDQFWKWFFRSLSLAHFVRGGFTINQRKELLFSSHSYSHPSSPGSFFRINAGKKKHEGFVGIVVVFLQETLMFNISICNCLWMFILGFSSFFSAIWELLLWYPKTQFSPHLSEVHSRQLWELRLLWTNWILLNWISVSRRS